MTTYKPKVRDSFSDRNKFEIINTKIQKDDLDERTRNGIVNLFDDIMNDIRNAAIRNEFYEYIYKYIFYVTEDEIPPQYSPNRRMCIINGIKKEWQYYDIFSFLEEILKWYGNRFGDYSLYSTFNIFFEKECVGYRFIDEKITDIINNNEIKEIEEAINNKYSTCGECISKALEHLYDRQNPDYSNSVKESISAIESMCNIILNTKNSTLGDALNKLENEGIIIHGAMKKAFSSLYGYTSDKSGIRHKYAIDEKTSFEEAKFMLVTCSAFLNYLIQVYEKTLSYTKDRYY